MKQILVPTDFSQNALNAFHFALQVADKLNASITTLHTYVLRFITPSDTDLSALQDMIDHEVDIEFEQYKQETAKLHQFAEEKGLGHVSITHELRKGFIADEIEEVTKSLNIELVVMGTKGASGLKEALLGSNTAAVLERVKCPVMVVPHKANFSGINKVAYATNCDEHDEEIIPKVKAFAQLFGAEMRCVHVTFLDEAWDKRKLEEFEELYNKMIETTGSKLDIMESDGVVEGLNQYIDQNEISVIAMHTHKRNLLEKIFLSSYTHRMAYHTHVPLLSYCK